MLGFTVFRLLRNAFWQPTSTFGMIWSLVPHLEQSYINSPRNSVILSSMKSSFFQKVSPILYRGDTMPLHHCKIVCGYVLHQYLWGSGLEHFDTLELEKLGMEWQEFSRMRYYKNRMLLFQTFLDTTSRRNLFMTLIFDIQVKITIKVHIDLFKWLSLFSQQHPKKCS